MSPRVGIKGYFFVLWVGNACLNTFLSVIPLVDLITLVDSPSTYLSNKAIIKLLSLSREVSIELYCRIFIKDKTIPFLLSHNPGDIVFKLNGFQWVTLSHQLPEQLKGDYNVLFVVLVHLSGKRVPCILFFSIGTFQLTQPIPICLQAVGTIESLRELASTHKTNVSVLNVRVDQTSKYKSVNTYISNIKCKPLTLKFLKSWDIEFADIMAYDVIPASAILVQSFK